MEWETTMRDDYDDDDVAEGRATVHAMLLVVSLFVVHIMLIGAVIRVVAPDMWVQMLTEPYE